MDRAFAPLRTKRNSMGQEIWVAGSLFPCGLCINLKAKLSQSGHKATVSPGQWHWSQC